MVKMKPCKNCQEEIPAKIPRCEYCGASQRSGFLGPTVIILCAFLTVTWIVTHKASAKPAVQTAATRAVGMCEHAVRNAASHPTSVNFSEFGSQPPTKMSDGVYRVRVAFRETDALGDGIAKEAMCTVKDGKLRSFKEPRP